MGPASTHRGYHYCEGKPDALTGSHQRLGRLQCNHARIRPLAENTRPLRRRRMLQPAREQPTSRQRQNSLVGLHRRRLRGEKHLVQPTVRGLAGPSHPPALAPEPAERRRHQRHPRTAGLCVSPSARPTGPHALPKGGTQIPSRLQAVPQSGRNHPAHAVGSRSPVHRPRQPRRGQHRPRVPNLQPK